MAIAKRIVLFLLTNLLIMVSVSILLNLLGVQPYLTAKGLDYKSLAVFCLVWGFGGAFISLGLSRVIAKWMMKVRLVDPATASPDERWIMDAVQRLSALAGLTRTPQVGIYESDDANAFATGPTKARSLVAVSSGLLRNMNKAEVEGVLAHEVAHIANGDMVTMTLVQGVVNAFVMFLSRVVAWSLSQFVDEEKRGLVNFVAVLAFDIAFGLLGMVVVAQFSRQREFRADRGGAGLIGRQRMAQSLRALKNIVPMPETGSESLTAFKISAPKGRGLLALIATHPPLDERIRRLEMTG